MSYYILPKNNNTVEVCPCSSLEPITPFLSYSFLTYYVDIKQQIVEMFACDQEDAHTLEEAIRLINPYEFIFSKVPGSKFSVSKLKPSTNLFYDLYEILNNTNLLDSFADQSMTSLHLSRCSDDSVECFEMFREGQTNETHTRAEVTDDEAQTNAYHYLFVDSPLEEEADDHSYFVYLVKVLITLLRGQAFSGHAIIKVRETMHKPVLDFVYLLSSLYDKVYLTKPNTNNITTLDRYLVCKSFQHGESSLTYLKMNAVRLIVFLRKLEEGHHIHRLIDGDIPYYFKNKMDDLNIIIGQQQIEALDQIISLFKNKNKGDKIENLKKSNIQKSVHWCEKHKIPCNKFAEKINIFLPLQEESEELR